VDHRCDLFSLGCVLYRALTGQKSFPGEDTMAILMSLVEHTPSPIRQLGVDIPAALDELIARLLAKDANARPASAADVAQALAWIEGQLVGGPASGAAFMPSAQQELELAGAGRRTHRWRWLVAAAVGVSAVIFTGAFLLTNSRPRSEKPQPLENPNTLTTTPTPVVDADRAAAEWVLGAGGYLHLQTAASDKLKVDARYRLPKEGGFQVYDISLSRPGVRFRGDVGQLKPLKHLQGLTLDNTDLTDQDLETLAGVLPTLQSLRVSRTSVTHAGLARQFHRLKRLEMLAPPSKMQDIHLPALGALPKLVRLELDSPQVSGAGLLKHLPRLEVLMLAGGEFFDHDLEPISRMPEIVRLELIDGNITDLGVGHLRNGKFTKLKLECGLTDVGLLQLIGMTTLLELDIDEKNQFTAAGVATLQKALPDCKIKWRQPIVPTAE
jgi:hypothetical protein